MKKFLLSWIALATAFSVSAHTDNGIEYTLNNAAQTAVVVANTNGYTGDIVIPDEFNVPQTNRTYTVVGIEANAFEGNVITSVKIGNNVTSIGKWAFYGCANLTSVEFGTGIGNGVEIPANAFQQSKAITSVTCNATVPASIYYAGFESDVYSNATLYVPESAISAYQDQFNSWYRFSKIEAIGTGGGGGGGDVKVDKVNVNGLVYYLDHNNMTASVAPAYSEKSYDISGYSGNVEIPEEISANGTTYTVTYLYPECFYQTSPVTIKFPSTLKSVGWESFYNISSITRLDFPDSVEEIENGCFYNLSSITEIVLGSGLKKLGGNSAYVGYCFMAMPKLANITCLAETPPTATELTFQPAVKQNATLTVPKGKADVYRNAPNWGGFKDYIEIGNPVADNIAWVNGIRYSFSTREYGTTGKFECSTYKPSDEAFPSGNEYTGDIVIPEEVAYNGKTYVVTSIGRQSFYDQSGVTSVTAPSTIETIDTQALSGTSITSFIIPEKVQTLYLYPFMSCSKLTELVSLNPEPPATYANTFQGVNVQTVTLYVPKGCVNVYKNATRWQDFLNIEEYGDSPIRPTSVSITKHPSVMITGGTSQLECKVEPEDATDNTVTWKSLDTSVLTVSETGLLTAVAPGRAYVEAICNGDNSVSTNCNVIVIAEQSTIDGLTYRFELDEEQRIANAYLLRNDSYKGSIVIPELVQNGSTFTVKGIEQNAFALNNNVTSVTIPQTVETIGKSAFRQCQGLTTVNITNLGAWAQIDFGDKLATPLNNEGVKFLVNGQEIKSLNVDSSLETVKPFTLLGISSLETLKFSDGVRTIGQSAFERCTSLKNIEFAATTDSIGLSAFAGCSSLAEVNLPAGIRTLSGGVLSGCALESVVVPQNVTVIDNQAFQNNANLKEVVLPESLKMIYLMVFTGCPSLTSLTVNAATPPAFFSGQTSYPVADFEESVYSTATLYVPAESLDDYKKAYGWKKFMNIKAIGAEPDPIVAEIDGITYNLYENRSTATVVSGVPVDNTLVIPSEVSYEQNKYQVTAIAEKAFFNVKELVNITIGDNVEEIGKSAFAGTGIDIVAIPQKVCKINDGTFENCENLISVSLPDGLEAIGVKAFYGSPRIRYIFCNVKGEDLTPPVFDTYYGDPTTYGEAFSTAIWPDCQLVIPASMFSNYKKCEGWKNFKSWVYWHDYDILPTSIELTPAQATGSVGETIQVKPSLLPSNALQTNFIVTDLDNDMVELSTGKDESNQFVYNIKLLKEGETSFNLYCGLNKTIVDISITAPSSIDGIESDGTEKARYFNMQGLEIERPVSGQPYIEVRNGKSQKKINR